MKRWQILLNIILEFLSFFVCAGILIFAVPKLLGFFWPFVASWILAMLASPLCTYLEKHIRLNKRWGSALIILLVLFLVAGFLYGLISMIGRELVSLLSNMPAYYKTFTDMIDDLGKSLSNVNNPIVPDLGAGIQTVTRDITRLAGTFANQVAPKSVAMIGSAAANLTNGLIGIVVMFLSAYFFIADRDRLAGRLAKVLPDELYARASDIRKRLVEALEGFFIAQFKIMGIIFLILLLGFILMGNPYAFLLALIIAFLDLLPVIGTGTVLIPWAVLTLVQRNFRQGIFLLVLYIICLLGRQLLQPKIIGDSMGMGTLPTLFLIYTGYKLDGMKGVILALFVGIIFLTFFRLGLFDEKIARINRLWKEYREYDYDI